MALIDKRRRREKPGDEPGFFYRKIQSPQTPHAYRDEEFEEFAESIEKIGDSLEFENGAKNGLEDYEDQAAEIARASVRTTRNPAEP